MLVHGPPAKRRWRGARDAAHARLLVAVAVVAAGAGAAGLLTEAWAPIENATVDARFSLRVARHPADVVVVGIDDATPPSRALAARAIEVLRADHARTIVDDIQPSKPEVLGAGRNLAHAQEAAASLFANSSGIVQRYPYEVGGLRSVAVASAETYGADPLSSAGFSGGSAWIDFPGAAFPRVSFADLVRGRVEPSEFAGKVVVVGATSPVLQDVHPTSVASEMPVLEVWASAIETALEDNPLRQIPVWLALLVTLLAGVATPLSCLTIRPGRALVMGLGLATAYALLAQLEFGQGWILPVSYPLVALAIGTLGSLLVSYLAEVWQHELSDRHGERLEDTVRARTAELYDTQREVIRRLAQAAELRDDDTGAHIERVGRLCERLALKLGMGSAEAGRLRIASTLHDVGKIGVPDHVLLKRGELDDEEWAAMKAHTSTGAALLAGSNSPLLKMAEEIARSHHERWDGDGYPAGLKGTDIPLVGRICAICDVFDALASRRSYKDPWRRERILKEIVRNRGTHFDPRVVDAFLEVIREVDIDGADADAADISARAMAAARY